MSNGVTVDIIVECEYSITITKEMCNDEFGEDWESLTDDDLKEIAIELMHSEDMIDDTIVDTRLTRW